VSVDAVVGKYEAIDFAVGIGTDGTVKQIEVLTYRESHGHEIRMPAWRRQFVGKGAAAKPHLVELVANDGAIAVQHIVPYQLRRDANLAPYPVGERHRLLLEGRHQRQQRF
jgi:hypothetical protein